MKRLFGVLFVITAFLGSLSEDVNGQGLTIFQHSGAVDPTTEGFTLLLSGNPTLSPVNGDLGLDAWGINLLPPSSIAAYSSPILTPQQQANAESGWVLSLTVRILPPFNGPSFGIFGGFNTGGKSFNLILGAQPSGDPVVWLGNVPYSLDGGGSGYHHYELCYDGGAGAASLWIDGTERITGFAGGNSQTQPIFQWGGGQNPYGTLSANWNEASFTIVPEPTALALLSLGGLVWVVSLNRRSQPASRG